MVMMIRHSGLTMMARSRLLGASRSLDSSDNEVIAGVRSSTTAMARITHAAATASAANARICAKRHEYSKRFFGKIFVSLSLGKSQFFFEKLETSVKQHPFFK